MVNVGKCTSPMDAMGNDMTELEISQFSLLLPWYRCPVPAQTDPTGGSRNLDLDSPGGTCPQKVMVY